MLSLRLRALLVALALVVCAGRPAAAQTTQMLLVPWNNNPSSSVTVYAPLNYIDAYESTENRATNYMPAAGTFSKMRVDISAAPGAAASGKARDFYFRVNGVNTSLHCQIFEVATSCTDYVTAAVSVAVNDAVTIQCVPTLTPANAALGVRFTIEFTATTLGQSIYLGSGGTNVLAPPTWNAVFGGGQSYGLTSCAASTTPASAAGNLMGTWVTLNAVPGAGKSYTFQIYKNGTLQDGTGGTVNTVLTLGAAALTGSLSYTLPIVAGDRLCLEVTKVGVPLSRASVSYRFDATILRQWNLCSIDVTNPPTPGYGPLSVYYGSFGTSWQGAVGFVSDNYVGSSGISVAYLELLEASADATNTHTYTVYKSHASTSLTGTIATSATTASDLTHTVSFSSGDTASILHTRSGATNAGQESWCLAASIGSPFVASNTIQRRTLDKEGSRTGTRTPQPFWTLPRFLQPPAWRGGR